MEYMSTIRAGTHTTTSTNFLAFLRKYATKTIISAIPSTALTINVM